MDNQTPEFNKEREKIEKMVNLYSEKAGYRLNDNPEMLNMVIDGLTNNKIKYGFAYCPCRVVTEDKKEDAKIICPCIYHKDEIKNDGHCHCHLYFKRS
ncbi:MAG: ferredoxin-thioredoxin reductase catalytic domain-containing protein [Armatimonadota bacterium]